MLNCSPSDLARFEKKYIPEPNSGCWLWTGAVTGAGYGAFMFNGRMAESAHRASYVLHKGKIDEEMLVCHKCDNKLCVNPDHLFLGTYLDNTRDMIKKGRRVSPSTKNRMRGEDWRAAHDGTLRIGEDHHCAKLTEQNIIEIRASKKTGVALAEIYGVAPITISRIRRRIIWRHVS